MLDTISVEEDKDKKEISNIPDSIYFDGERCVSHSSGKIYYRYRGDFYSDSSEKVLLKKMFLGLGGGAIKKNKEIAYELWF